MRIHRTPHVVVPLWVYDHPRVSATIMCVYIALVATPGDPSIADLVERTGFSRSSVYDALSVLEAVRAIVAIGDGSYYLPLGRVEP